MGMLPLHCYGFFCLFPSQTERVLSTLGLFVLPTVSSLIASSNHETLQYFRASVLCKSCHSFHSLIINILRVSILEMKLGSSPIWKNVVPLTPYKWGAVFSDKSTLFQSELFLDCLTWQTCIQRQWGHPPQDACCCESCPAVKGCISKWSLVPAIQGVAVWAAKLCMWIIGHCFLSWAQYCCDHRLDSRKTSGFCCKKRRCTAGPGEEEESLHNSQGKKALGVPRTGRVTGGCEESSLGI